jgi:hypothetical protein
MSAQAIRVDRPAEDTAIMAEPIAFSILVVTAGVIWATNFNQLLGLGLFLGALLRLVLPTSRYITATIVIAPVLFALDRYNAPIAYEAIGYRQIFGGGAGIYLAFLVTAIVGRPRFRLWPVDIAIMLFFGLLALSLLFPEADEQGLAIFASNTLPLIGAYFACRRVAGPGTDLVLDAIVAAAAAAVLGRWALEGPGVSTDFFRAGTNWYLGPAVYGSLPLMLGWALALPSLFRLRVRTGRLRAFGRLSALALLSAELAFLQVKTVFVVIGLCTVVFVRIGREKMETGKPPPPLTLRGIVTAMFLVMLATFAFSILNERIGNLYSAFWGNESDQLRLTSMVEHLHLVLARPFGYGFSGLYEAALPRSAQTSHNALIDIVGDAGVIAAGALAFAIVAVTYMVLQRRRSLIKDSDDWWTWSRLALGGTALVSAILINGSVLYREFPIPSAVLPFCFFGVVVAWCTRNNPGPGTHQT